MTDNSTSRAPVGRPDSAIGRYGEPTSTGGTGFRCAACHELAAVVKLAAAEQTVNMGPPLGAQSHGRNGIIIDYWLGSTSWQAVDADTWTSVREILAADRPDAAALHAIDWEMAPFYCRICETCYFRSDWHPIAIWDGPFYDYTEGRCPAGHRQRIED